MSHAEGALAAREDASARGGSAPADRNAMQLARQTRATLQCVWGGVLCPAVTGLQWRRGELATKYDKFVRTWSISYSIKYHNS